MSVIELPALLTEARAYEEFGDYLADKELRMARRSGDLPFYYFKGKIHYREDDLTQYIHDRLEQCRQSVEKEPSLSLADTGSSPSPAARSSTDSGMTRELEMCAAEALRRKISKKPR